MGLFIMKIVQISRGELSREINCRTEACIVARQPLFCLVFGFSAQLLLLKCSQGSRAPYFILIASFWRVMLCPWEGVLFHCLSSSYNESTKANLVIVLNFGKILHFLVQITAQFVAEISVRGENIHLFSAGLTYISKFE